MAALRSDVEATSATVANTSADSGAITQTSGGDEDDESERYELLDELGRGGMGIVYKARDTRLGRMVALKRLPENLQEHPTAVKLFLREARSAAALNHPNIVTLFDAGQSKGVYFLTMELLEGQPLDKILEAHGRLRPQDAARLGVQIATGLQYAHENRIVHRDIKTANLFFTRDKVLKIMDFGLGEDDGGGAPRRDRHRRHALLHGAGTERRRQRRPPRRPPTPSA